MKKRSLSNMASIRHLLQPLQNLKLVPKCNDTSLLLNNLNTIRYLTSSSILHKRTPHTIGVMSWVRAARRRKYLEQQMKDHEKPEHQLMREEQLARTEPEIEYRLASYVKREINEDQMKKLHIKPQVFMSGDKKTIVCYHPPPNDYPIEFTKKATGIDFYALDRNVLSTFRNEMTEEEIAEGSRLKEEDPRTWDDQNLAKLFKIKPRVLAKNIPLTKDQSERFEAEKDLYESMSVLKRKKLKELQNWERLRYVRESRGKEHAKFFESVGTRAKPKTLVPPKF